MGLKHRLPVQESARLIDERRQGVSLLTLSRRFGISVRRVVRTLRDAGVSEPYYHHSTGPRCLHCQRRAANPTMRGLCVKCFRDREVRHRYPLLGKPQKRVPCRHCKAFPATRSKGLCFRCSQSAEIRTLYPSTSKFARRESPTGKRTMPEPTKHAPGTPGKVDEMVARMQLNQELFNPRDATGDNVPVEMLTGKGAPPQRLLWESITEDEDDE